MTEDRPLFAHFFRCRTCGNRFSVKRLTADPSKVKTPKCPRRGCAGRVKESHMADVGMDVGAGKAPAQVGAIAVRAYDMALEVGAESAGLTDIKDHARPGESLVPALRPDLQKQADSFWGSGQKRQTQKGTIKGRVDLSGLYGSRATEAQGSQPPGMKFEAGQGHAIAPILQAQPTGTSPVPKYRDVAPPAR
jgi:hypothetical protein